MIFRLLHGQNALPYVMEAREQGKWDAKVLITRSYQMKLVLHLVLNQKRHATHFLVLNRFDNQITVAQKIASIVEYVPMGCAIAPIHSMLLNVSFQVNAMDCCPKRYEVGSIVHESSREETSRVFPESTNIECVIISREVVVRAIWI